MRDKAHAEEVGRRAWEIYEQSLSYELEPEHVGQFVVVDVTTGDYFLSDTTHAGFPTSEGASEKAEASNPSGEFFLLKVGYRAAYGIGARPKRLPREPGDPRAG